MADDPEPARRRCLNCETALVGEYCSACGQRDLPSRLAIGELIRDVLSETFELDGRVLRTLIPLLTRPGLLTREYAAGRRARYTTPFRLFLATTLLWLFTSFIAEHTRELAVERSGSGDITVNLPSEDEEGSPATAWLRERGEALAQLSDEELAQRFWDAGRETLPKSALLTIPIFALLMKLLFIRKDRYYVEHLVFALHVHAFAFLVLAIAVLFEDDLVGILAMLGILTYLYVALWKAYEARWWTSALRLLALVFIHGFVLMVTTAIMVLITMLAG